jgi:hypothetical protein
MVKQANRYCREEEFKIREQVFLSLKDYKMARPSRKLAEQNKSPFKVIKKKRSSYWLALPSAMKICPMFSPDKL